MGSHSDRIPPAQRTIIDRALDDAAASRGIEGLSPGPQGASGASTFRVHRDAGDLLVRVEGSKLPGRNPHQYQNLQTAAAAGIAPTIHLADDDRGVIVMDWIEQHPLTEHPGGPEGLAVAIGQLVQRVQSLDPFPDGQDWADVIDNMLAHLTETGVYAPGLLDSHVATFRRIREAWPRDPARFVPAHNDPNASNILFDGRRLWLVDWETSAPNDALVDVAVAANQFGLTPATRDALLTAWRGSPPDDLVRARLTLAQEACKLFAACALAMVGRGAATETDLTAPSMETFMARVADGSLSMTEPESLALLAKVVLVGFQQTTSTPAFDAALETSAAG